MPRRESNNRNKKTSSVIRILIQNECLKQRLTPQHICQQKHYENFSD